MKDVWQQWLDELRAMDPEAPEWEQSAAFAESVRTVAAEKATERAIIRTRRRVDGAIAAVQPDMRAWLDYAAVAERPAWAAATCPAERLEEALRKLDELANGLGDFRDLQSRPRPQTRQERVQLHQDMDTTDSHIEAVSRQVSALLSGQDGEPTVMRRPIPLAMQPAAEALAGTRYAPQPLVSPPPVPVQAQPAAAVAEQMPAAASLRSAPAAPAPPPEAVAALAQSEASAAQPAAPEPPRPSKALPSVDVRNLSAGRAAAPAPEQPTVADLVKRLQALSKRDEM